MVGAGVYIVCESTFFTYQSFRNRLSVVRAECSQRVFFTDAFIPTRHHETWIINIVVEVVVREEQIVDVQRM